MNTNQKTTKTPTNTVTRDIMVLAAKTGNVYKSIRIIGKRANQITVDLKRNIEEKLHEFSSYADSPMEISENKERIEISRFFERRPKSTLLATQEFIDDKIYYRDLSEEIDRDE